MISANTVILNSDTIEKSSIASTYEKCKHVTIIFLVIIYKLHIKIDGCIIVEPVSEIKEELFHNVCLCVFTIGLDAIWIFSH